eukprot:COSAG01_NODE_405_length_17466_cov_554.403697_25_plen_110_part_00
MGIRSVTSSRRRQLAGQRHRPDSAAAAAAATAGAAIAVEEGQGQGQGQGAAGVNMKGAGSPGRRRQLSSHRLSVVFVVTTTSAVVSAAVATQLGANVSLKRLLDESPWL